MRIIFLYIAALIPLIILLYINKPTVYYDENGYKCKATRKNNLEHGKVVCYYSNGSIRSEGKYRHGKKEGVHKKYYENGVLEEEATYEDGEENGYLKLYDENGNIYLKFKYLSGNIVEATDEYGNGWKYNIITGEKKWYP